MSEQETKKMEYGYIEGNILKVPYEFGSGSLFTRKNTFLACNCYEHIEDEEVEDNIIIIGSGIKCFEPYEDNAIVYKEHKDSANPRFNHNVVWIYEYDKWTEYILK